MFLLLLHRNLTLLSFADDEEMNEEQDHGDSNIAIIAKSVHDLEDQTKFSKKTVEEQIKETKALEEKQKEEESAAKVKTAAPIQLC